MRRKFVILLTSLIVLFIAVPTVKASSSKVVNATVQISVCGNGITENGEDCDNTDLVGETCLKCDKSCSFDSSACIPTPTPVSLRSFVSRPFLPKLVQIFDLNKDGILNTDEFYPALEQWINHWKQHQACDINADSVCDLRDFSVLLFYIKK